MVRDLVIALSLANLFFFVVWAELLPGAPAHYFMQGPPPRVAFTAACVNVLLATIAFWCTVRLVRRVDHPVSTLLGEVGFLAVVVVILNGLRLKIPFLQSATSTSTGLLTQPFILVGGALIAVLWLHRKVFRIAAVLVLIMAPFALVTLGRACWTWIRYDVAFPDFLSREGPLAVDAGAMPARRVLWLVFDELDQRLAFEHRPSSVDLPEFDRFSSESIVATSAYPPANDTLHSIPALITGRIVAEARPASANDLLIRFAGSTDEVPWSEQENAFSRARAIGVNCGLVGSYHPYCRVLGAELAECAWQQWRRNVSFDALGTMLTQSAQVVEALPGSRHIGLNQSLRTLLGDALGPTRRSLAIRAYQDSLVSVKRIVNRPDLGLIFVHLPVPHPPYIFRRTTGEFARTGDSSYFDNLVLADRAFGEIRRAMENAAMWNETSIVVTADHGYRTELWHSKIPSNGEEAQIVGDTVDTRVPFMFKVPGQKSGVMYSRRLEIVRAQDLVLALLTAEITNVAAALAWLDEDRQNKTAPIGQQAHGSRMVRDWLGAPEGGSSACAV